MEYNNNVIRRQDRLLSNEGGTVAAPYWRIRSSFYD